MSPQALILTSLLLGAFVAAGGAYGLLLSVGYALHQPRWQPYALAAYAFQCALALAILAVTPLDWWWKLLVAGSAAAYYFVPPFTWRYLVHLHGPEEPSL